MTFALATFLLSTVTANAQPAIAGCTPDRFMTAGSNVTISTAGTSYTPKCLRVKIGTQITIQATSHHPLAAMPAIGGALNPFASSRSHVTPQTRVMNAPGTFGYFCDAHGDSEGDGMAGLIVVEP